MVLSERYQAGNGKAIFLNKNSKNPLLIWTVLVSPPRAPFSASAGKRLLAFDPETRRAATGPGTNRWRASYIEGQYLAQGTFFTCLFHARTPGDAGEVAYLLFTRQKMEGKQYVTADYIDVCVGTFGFVFEYGSCSDERGEQHRQRHVRRLQQQHGRHEQ